VGLSQPRCLEHVCNDPGWTLSSTQPVDCDTVHLLITPAVADLTHDLDCDRHYTHLRRPARDRNKVLVEPPRDGTQNCLYHIVVAFVGHSMTQVRRGLGPCDLQPTNQAKLCDMLPRNLQNPAEWSWRSRSALKPSNLMDECDLIVWLSSLMFAFRFCPQLRVSRSSKYIVQGV